MVSELLKSLDVSNTAEPALPAGKADGAEAEQDDKAEEVQKDPEVDPAAAQQPPDVLPGAEKPDGASTAGALCTG